MNIDNAALVPSDICPHGPGPGPRGHLLPAETDSIQPCTRRPGPQRTLVGAYLVLEANFLSKFLLPQEATEVCRACVRPGRSKAPWPPRRARSRAQEPLSPATPAHISRSERPARTSGRRTDVTGHRVAGRPRSCVGGANLTYGRGCGAEL